MLWQTPPRGEGMQSFSTSHFTDALCNNNHSFDLLCTIHVEGDKQLGQIVSVSDTETGCRVGQGNVFLCQA